MKTVVYTLDAGGNDNLGWVRVHKCPGDINKYVPIITPYIDQIIDCLSKHETNYKSGDNLKTLSNLIYKVT
ncbi:hypothetical protein A9P44_03515 [Paenibacillus polymyxa]|nr:hypothetical protein [Paenibacillus polymyxa]OBA06000.1 hypothetical protein A9P44_03515 [Paenibacillus polymyxa]